MIFFFSIVFTVEGVRRKFPAQRYRTREKLAGKLKYVPLLFSIGLNILLCYKYFGVMVSKNFIAVALRGQGEGYCLDFAALKFHLGHDCWALTQLMKMHLITMGRVSWK